MGWNPIGLGPYKKRDTRGVSQRKGDVRMQRGYSRLQANKRGFRRNSLPTP